MITINNDTSSTVDTNVLKMAQVAKTNSKIVKAATTISEPCDKRTISQILRDSSGGFSFRR
jgi:hypothetical protein